MKWDDTYDILKPFIHYSKTSKYLLMQVTQNDRKLQKLNISNHRDNLQYFNAS